MYKENKLKLKHISHDDIKPGYYIVKEQTYADDDFVIVVVGCDSDDGFFVCYHGNEERFDLVDLDNVKFIQAIDTLEIMKFYQDKK